MKEEETAYETDTSSNIPQDLKRSLQKIIEKAPKEEDGLSLEIDGLVIDNTLTKSGRDFYEVFYSQWNPPAQATDFTILINEAPGRGPGIGTQVEILLNDSKVLAIPMHPRYNVVEDAAKAAVQRVYSYLLNYEQIQLDLEGEDQSGTGIF